MRLSTIAGLVLLIAGIVFLVRGGVTTREDVIHLGDLTVTATEKRSVEPWLAGGAIVAGIALIVVGVRNKGPNTRF
jgi:hypothetical protein